MRISPRSVAPVLLCVILLTSCDDPANPPYFGQPLPPVPVGIHLAVGNMYYWRFTRISTQGSILVWHETRAVVRDTTIYRRRYFVFTTGELLFNSGDTVFAFAGDSLSVYYRFGATAGQTVPFLGTMLRVTSVESDSVFRERQQVVTVSSPSLSPAAISRGRYATKFGLLEVERSEPTHVTLGLLVGARLGNVEYGYRP